MGMIESIPLSERPTGVPMTTRPEANGRTDEQRTPSGPSYHYHRPWIERFIGLGCRGCGGTAPGWVQRQIETPHRIKRFALWTANLFPRGWSLIRTVASRRVSLEQKAERDAQCATCPHKWTGQSWEPGLVIELRQVKGEMRETKFCGHCTCGKWRMPRWLRWLWDLGSHLDYKNAKAGHRCPLRRHLGSDPNLVYANHRRAKAAQANAEGNDRGGSDDA